MFLSPPCWVSVFIIFPIDHVKQLDMLFAESVLNKYIYHCLSYKYSQVNIIKNIYINIYSTYNLNSTVQEREKGL